MAMMARYPDKYFDLAIVDPPYGGGQHFNFRHGTGDSVYDSRKPNPEYWQELFRVSKNQIVWGGNYFTADLPENRCWIVWNKANPAPNFSDFELAWTSFQKVNKAINLQSYGFNHPDKIGGYGVIHPTQKPVSLYRELLKRFAVSNDKIIDTHLGGGSIAIACNELGFDLTACEIDSDYFEKTMKRIEQNLSAPKLTL